MAKKLHTVRVMQTVRVAEGDTPKFNGAGKIWHVPGQESAVFQCGRERPNWLLDSGYAVELNKAGQALKLEPAEPDEKPDHLPSEFPYRAKLYAKGLTSLTSLRTYPDLAAESLGLGRAEAETVLAALAVIDEYEAGKVAERGAASTPDPEEETDTDGEPEDE